MSVAAQCQCTWKEKVSAQSISDHPNPRCPYRNTGEQVSDFISEEEFVPPHVAWEEFQERVQERLEAHGIIEGEDPFDAATTALADMQIALQQVYIIMRTIREELEKMSE